tara:strand:+ start:315 stop:629 length:315 start_codon:yes stop_codon:yes gene_type:complete
MATDEYEAGKIVRVREGEILNPRVDNVGSPRHYLDGKMETIDKIRNAVIAAHGLAGWLGFLLGQQIKYIDRAGLKDSLEQDVGKARWYMRMYAGDDPRHDRGTE